MRFTFAAFFATVLALAASQSTTASTGTSAFSAPIPSATYLPNYFIPPAAGYLLHAGQPFTFKWHPTTGGTVTLTLRNGPNGDLNPGTVIASKIDNSGSYTFTPPTDITPDVSYTVEISDDQDPSLVNYTQQFDITNDNPPPASSSASKSRSSTGTTPLSTFSTISGTTTSGASTSASASASASASNASASASASASGSSSASGSASSSGTSSPSPSSTTQATNGAAGVKVGGNLMAAVLVVAAAL